MRKEDEEMRRLVKREMEASRKEKKRIDEEQRKLDKI